MDRFSWPDQPDCEQAGGAGLADMRIAAPEGCSGGLRRWLERWPKGRMFGTITGTMWMSRQ